MMKRIINKTKSNNQAFTLIEVVLYISIFALIIGAVVALAILAVSARQKNEDITAVNYQGESVLGLISQTVHSANSIASPIIGTSGSALSLVMPTSSVNPTIFSSYNDGSTTHLEISEGSPSVNNYLTNSHVIVSNLTFTNLALTGTKGSILISFTLSYNSSNSLQEFKYQKTFNGAATIP